MTHNGDLIIGTRSDDAIDGTDGNDIIISLKGDDQINSGDGNDKVFSGSGDDVVNSGDGNDKVFAGSGDDVINAGAGDDKVYAGFGNDTLHHDVNENLNDHDYANGGWGYDHLILHLNFDQADEIIAAGILDDFAAASSWHKFKFSDYDLSFSLDLNVRSFEQLSLEINNVGPTAIDDAASVIEAGSSNPNEPAEIFGNVLINDQDENLADGDELRVSAVNGQAADVGIAIVGLYGTLLLNADGSYSYELDNNNPVVDALDDGDQLVEVFDYTVSDRGDLSDVGQLVITIDGRDDNSAPTAVADTFMVDDVVNNSPVVVGNVLANDTDPDLEPGEVLKVADQAFSISTVVPPPYDDVIDLDISINAPNPGEAVSFSLTLSGVLANGDDSAELVVKENGDIELTSNGIFDFLPEGESLQISINYIAEDPDGEVSSPALATIVVNGSDNNDVFIGTEGDDVINGGAGNDTIFGNGGDDQIAGGDGDDFIDGGDGNDMLFGNAGADEILGGAGDDYIEGGAGVDIIDPGPGMNTVYQDDAPMDPGGGGDDDDAGGGDPGGNPGDGGPGDGTDDDTGGGGPVGPGDGGPGDGTDDGTGDGGVIIPPDAPLI